MKEGKVIKIMRRERRESVGVVQFVRVELALFQRCGFSSSELRVCFFLGFAGLQRHSAAGGGNQFLVTIKYKL